MPEYTSTSVYTILHSNDLGKIFRSGGNGTFTEGKKWVTAAKLLRAARSAGEVVPVIFARRGDLGSPYFAELAAVKINEDDGKWSTKISVTKLTKFRHPLPNKTQLTVCSTGEKLPGNHIRPYVLVQTPSFLTKKTKNAALYVPSDHPVCTSRFGSYKALLAAGVMPFAISRGKPAWYRGESDDRLAPTRDMLKRFTSEQYDEAFFKMLLAVDPVDFYEELLAYGKPVALLCWCKVGAFCHRRYVADWLEAHVPNVVVPEFGVPRNETGQYATFTFD